MIARAERNRTNRIYIQLLQKGHHRRDAQNDLRAEESHYWEGGRSWTAKNWKPPAHRDWSPVLFNVSKPVANFPLLPTDRVRQLVSYSPGVRLLLIEYTMKTKKSLPFLKFSAQNDQSHLAIKANLGEERGGGGGSLSCRAVLNHGSGLQGEYKKLSGREWISRGAFMMAKILTRFWKVYDCE